MTEYIPEDLYAAARVSSFMEEGECGRWRLRHFTVTPDDVRRKELKIAFGSERNAEQIRMAKDLLANLRTAKARLQRAAAQLEVEV